jgi:hypothetical protein
MDGEPAVFNEFFWKLSDDNALDKNLRSNQLLSIESQSLEPSNISESEIWEDFKLHTVDVPTAVNRYLFARCEGGWRHCETSGTSLAIHI